MQDLGPVPQRILCTNATITAIGLGTFRFGHVSDQAVTEIVKDAAAVGYPHFDCASVYANED